MTELLQTISLSRKSGVLEICSEDEVAWLGLREGGIVRVAVSDQNLTRSVALKDAGLDDDSPSDAVEACLWDAAVSAILSLFEWREGEFTFNPEEDPNENWRGPEGLVLPTSLSPEFLALEGARLEDESDEPEGDVMFGFEGDTPAPEPEPEPDGEPSDDSRSVAPPPVLVTPDHPESEVEEAPQQEPPAPEPPPASPASPPAPVIAVAGELALLEFIKDGLAPGEMPVHIFQESRLAFERLKQYLVRGAVPTLVISVDVSDPDERGGRWEQLATRVRRMAPAARLVLMSPDKNATSDLVDAIVVPCDPTCASDHQKREFLYALATSLREDA